MDADRETIPLRVIVGVMDAWDEILASLDGDWLPIDDFEEDPVADIECVTETDCEADGYAETLSAELLVAESVANVVAVSYSDTVAAGDTENATVWDCKGDSEWKFDEEYVSVTEGLVEAVPRVLPVVQLDTLGDPEFQEAVGE